MHRSARGGLTAVTAPAQADAFAAKGAKGTLTVEYVYESSGKKADKYDSHEWRVKRSATLSADLAAQAPQALPRRCTELDGRPEGRPEEQAGRRPRAPRRRWRR